MLIKLEKCHLCLNGGKLTDLEGQEHYHQVLAVSLSSILMENILMLSFIKSDHNKQVF